MLKNAVPKKSGGRPENLTWRMPSVEPAVLLLPLRLFLGAGWLRAASEKMIEIRWWQGVYLQEFLVDQHETALPFFRPVMEFVIAPNSVTVASGRYC